MTKFVLLTCLLAASPAFADVGAEIALLSGNYNLVKAEAGNCPESIKIREENFAHAQGPGIGIYSNVPGDVILQSSDFNRGPKTEWETNPMSGLPSGYTVSRADIGNGQLVSSFENHNVIGLMMFVDTFAGKYSEDSLEFTRAYNGGTFNGIRFTQKCVYSKNK